MQLFTIGFTQKSARVFFELLKKHNIDLLVDIRLNNESQLAGFTKGSDLEYFLKEICNCTYKHCDEYAPTKEILDNYKKKIITWEDYEIQYKNLMNNMSTYKKFTDKYSTYQNVCLLCSEPTAEFCHRRLLAELITTENIDVKVKHI